jgi:DNA repair protein RadA/Sms
MSRRHRTHRCTACGAGSHRWAGRCPSCAEWNTLVEEADDAGWGPGVGPGGRWPAGDPEADLPVALGDVDGAAAAPVPTGVAELDRVLGGGLVPGSVTLLGGEPGIGKSTLLLQAMAALAVGGTRCLLVCAEESAQQVRRRAGRLDAATPGVFVIGVRCLQQVVAAIERLAPAVIVVDSIQSLFDTELGSPPGSVPQVRGCAQALVALAKGRTLTVVLVGHVTKDGMLAGPRELEHVVDTVLTFEGERHHALRLLRAVKHRFGATGELGLFEMTDRGLAGVADPGHLFLGDRRPGSAGSAVFPAMEGHRPLVVEVQALVVPSRLALPRRSAQGVDAGRVSLLLAVLQRRAGMSLSAADVYVSAVGGVRVAEPGADLALCLAMASAAADRPLRPDVAICGEVGLAGEVRQVAQTPRRLAEAARLGFRLALVPVGTEAPGGSLSIVALRSLREAVCWAGLSGAAPGERRRARRLTAREDDRPGPRGSPTGPVPPRPSPPRPVLRRLRG